MIKKKMVTVEVRTSINNNDLKNVYRQKIHSDVEVDQVTVSLMQPVKSEKKYRNIK